VKTADLLVIAPPESRRVRAIQTSLLERGLPPAQVLSWIEIADGVPLESFVGPGTTIKLDSPGESWDTEKRFLGLGLDIPDSDGVYTRINPRVLEFELGRLLASRQWYLGFSEALKLVNTQLEALGRPAMNSPDDIALMFDKRATHAKLQAAGITVPPALTPVTNFDELVAGMEALNWSRVFVKLAHGSGAAGVIALETRRGQWQATSTVEMAGGRLFNTRRLWKYRDLRTIKALVNAILPHRVQIEKWLPKASFEGRIFDLRVVVTGGAAKHVLVRASRGTITNLHLGNERGDWDAVRARLGERWLAIKLSCEAALRAFPGSLYAGVDVLLQTDWERHAILEMNAFGDYHRNVLVNGLDTYATQLEALGWDVGAVMA
jgi:glutathione synthase/RimK-type ligase-like ATP-grasp enzyme